MKRCILTVIAVVLLASCASVDFKLQPRPQVTVGELSAPATYRVRTVYYDQDENGLTRSITEIEARVLAASTGDTSYYQWLEYRVRTYPAGSSLESRMEGPPQSAAPWVAYQPAIGFAYTMKGLASNENEELANLPNVDSVPRDLVGFQFYDNIIDFHTWDIYQDMFLTSHGSARAPIEKVGDVSTIPMPGKPIRLLDWPGLTSDFRFEGGFSKAEYLADVTRDGRALKLLSLEQNQRIRQTVYGMAGPVRLKMPYDGTTRLIGLMYFDADNRIWKASFNEYVYSRVSVPVLVPVIVHTKRAYSIERVE